MLSFLFLSQKASDERERIEKEKGRERENEKMILLDAFTKNGGSLL